MSNLAWSSTIFSWHKTPRLIAGLAAVFLLGQGCSVSVGTPTQVNGGVYRSDNHGQTWKQKNYIRTEKKRAVTINDATVLSFVFATTGSTNISIGTRDTGIWKTIDSGEHWKTTAVKTGSPTCLSIDQANPLTSYAASGAYVKKTMDGWQTSSNVYTESQPGQSVSCVAVDPLQANFVWAATTGGKILLSQDYGLTWHLQNTIPAGDVRTMFIDSDGSGRVTVVTVKKGIYVGENHGAQWKAEDLALKKFGNAIQINDFDAVSPTLWYAASGYGLIRSLDRGATWSPVPTLLTPASTPVSMVAVNPRDTRDMFVTVQQKLLHSTDSGVTWSVTTLPTSRPLTHLVFDPSVQDRMYFFTLKPLKK